MDTRTKKRFDPILAGILVLSAFLNVFNIWRDTYANAYYTAAVTSMLQNWHAFFFASLDSVGFVTIDKPPVTFWIQTLFAWVFGVHGWSVVLPQALADVGSVWLLYRLVRPTFGLAAARVAAVAMALTPIAVAVSRTNNVDGMLVFTLLVGAALLMRGIRTSRIAPLLGAFALVGIGFNEKMLEAYMALPAFVLLVVIAYRAGWRKKIAVLAASAAVLLVVSFSWAVTVDSIPADSRPYIGSSQTNSVLELAFGYNGLSRLTGMGRGRSDRRPQLAATQAGAGAVGATTPGDDGSRSGGASGASGAGGAAGGDGGGVNGRFGRGGGGFAPPTGVGGTSGNGFRGGGGGGMFGTGQPGPLRLFQREMAGQASWLLPFAAFGCIALLAGIRRRKPLTPAQIETLFWLGWLVPELIFFSVAGFIHTYYLIMLAPPIAALVGAGWSALAERTQAAGGGSRWLLPVGLLATTVFEVYTLHLFQNEIGMGWIYGIGAAGLAFSAAVLYAVRGRTRLWQPLALAGLLVLLLPPLDWATMPMRHGDNGSMPSAGPASADFGSFGGGGRGVAFARGANGGNVGQGQGAVGRSPARLGQNAAAGGGLAGGGQSRDGGVQGPAGGGRFPGQGNGQPFGFGDRGGRIDTKLVDFLTAHNDGDPYLFATTSAMNAAPYIIQTGKAVMAMGGFSGNDPILTVDKLKKLVEDGKVQYFLISPSGSGFGFGFPGGGGGRDSGLSQVQDWIRTNGSEVPAADWQSSDGSSQGGGFGFGGRGGEVLYQVTPAAAQDAK